MRNLMFLGMFAVVGALLSTVDASAADKAATTQMPPALQSVSVQPDQVLNSAEAHQVRGQGYWLTLNGCVATNNFRGSINLQGCLNYVNFYAATAATWLQAY